MVGVGNCCDVLVSVIRVGSIVNEVVSVIKIFSLVVLILCSVGVWVSSSGLVNMVIYVLGRVNVGRLLWYVGVVE